MSLSGIFTPHPNLQRSFNLQLKLFRSELRYAVRWRAQSKQLNKRPRYPRQKPQKQWRSAPGQADPRSLCATCCTNRTLQPDKVLILWQAARTVLREARRAPAPRGLPRASSTLWNPCCMRIPTGSSYRGCKQSHMCKADSAEAMHWAHGTFKSIRGPVASSPQACWALLAAEAWQALLGALRLPHPVIYFQYLMQNGTYVRRLRQSPAQSSSTALAGCRTSMRHAAAQGLTRTTREAENPKTTSNLIAGTICAAGTSPASYTSSAACYRQRVAS